MSFVFSSAVFTNDISGNAISQSTPILVATTTLGTLSTNFTAGSIVDGITISTGDRILIKNQTTGVENGVYIVQVGTPIRSNDFYIGTATAGKVFQIIEGTVNADTSWVVTSDPPNDIVGTSSLVFAQTTKTGAGSFTGGPVSSVVGSVALWNNATGTSLKQTTGISIDSSDNISGINALAFAGISAVTINSAAQTGASTITIPNLGGISGGMCIVTASQTLTNKTLTLPVISSISNGGTIMLPIGTDTLVARATIDTLTNKNITDYSNNVTAKNLATTGADVIIVGIPPTLNQMLTASSATVGAWSYQGWRQAVVSATTGNLDLTTNINGSIVDGVTVATGDRILLWQQTSPVQNGIYNVRSGAGSTARSSDMAIGSRVSMSYCYSSGGIISANKLFLCINVGTDTVGTNALVFMVNSISRPAISTNNAIAKWNGTGGNTLANSGILLDASNNISGVASINYTGGSGVTISSASQTGAGTILIPDLTGTSNTISLIDLAQTLTNKTLTNPIINNATLSIDDTTSIFSLSLVSTSVPALTANRSLTFDVSNANRIIDLNGDVTLSGAFSTTGANSLTLTTTGATNITLPTSGTLSTTTSGVQNAGGTSSILTDLLINLPAAGTAGRLFVALDTQTWYRDTGTLWNVIGAPATGSGGDIQIQSSTAGVFTSDPNLTWNTNKGSLVIGGSGGSGLANNPVDTDGNVNSYLQINIKNKSNGVNASSDIIATTNTGNDNSGYINFGINSMNYANAAYTSGGPGDGYLYCAGGNMTIMTDSIGKDVSFYAGGTLATDEKMRITSTGNITIGLNALDTAATNGFLYLPGCAGTPTGTPTTFSSRTPVVFDTTNKLLYYYISGWNPTVGTDSTQTLTNKTITSSRFNQFLDTAGNPELVLTATASSVNYLNLANAATATNPSITVTGTDINVGLNLIQKGTGAIQIKSTSSAAAGELRIYQDSASGSNYVGLRAPQAAAGFTTNTTYTFPTNYGLNGQYLMTGGSGGLSWGTPSGGGGSTYSMTTATTTYTTTSTGYTVITGMTVTPASGTYYVMFSSSASINASNNQFNFGIGVAGTVDTTSVRQVASAAIQSTGVIYSIVSNAIAVVNGSQAIDVRVLRLLGSGTLSVAERSLYIFKLA